MSNNRLVYSTDGGRVDYCRKCQQPKSACTCRTQRPAAPGGARAIPNDGIVRLHRDRKGRGGKTVTLITGVPGGERALADLCTTLKRLCGSGGAVKDGVIEIQGDHRERLAAKLDELGYKVKLAGG